MLVNTVTNTVIHPSPVTLPTETRDDTPVRHVSHAPFPQIKSVMTHRNPDEKKRRPGCYRDAAWAVLLRYSDKASDTSRVPTLARSATR